MLLVPPNLPHCWHFDNDDFEIENITVLFKDSMIRHIGDNIPELSNIITLFLKTDYAVSFTGSSRLKISAILSEMESESQEMLLISLLRLIVTISESKHKSIAGSYPKSDTDKKIDKINIFIACNYNRDITIDKIASHVGMNRSSVCNFYHKHTGKTLVTHLNNYRINTAKNLLNDRSRSIQQVCYESGFNDFSYFCRLFKKITGMTPGKFRESLSGQ